jgi:hypothetical protein
VPRRRLKLLLIHAFVALQLILPGGYYCGRKDRYDERFAWRMFSSIRMIRCGTGPGLRAPPEFAIGEPRKPINLRDHFHTAWIELTLRGRREVIEKMAAQLCRRHPGEPVFVRYDCRQIDGKLTTESSGGFDICRTGEL